MPLEDARLVIKAAWERDFFADLVSVQVSDLAYADKLQVYSDSLLTIRTAERGLYKETAEANAVLYAGAQKETKIVRKQKRKWVIIGLGSLAVATLEFVVIVAQATQTQN